MNKLSLFLHTKLLLSLPVIIILSSIVTPSLGQNKEQKEIIRAKTNSKILIQKAEALKKRQQAIKKEAITFAQKNDLSLKWNTTQENTIELQGLSSTGHPIYYTTFNLNAAKTISTNQVWTGGGLHLDLNGQGMLIGEWDGGPIAVSHDELDGRAFDKNGGVFINGHANHVAGTLIGAGIDREAKGMAPAANLNAYDWNFDESEMAIAAANGLLVSNHSYGLVLGWDDGVWMGDSTISQTEDYRFGFYNDRAKNWDEIAYNAPYYLIVKSAGNDRVDAGPSGENPDGGISGYDCIGGAGLSKNVLTVGAIEDIAAGYNNPNDVVMSSFSSWGPTDDGRIKPDLVGNGVSVYSLGNNSWGYAYKSGTSMAAPSVAGSLLLVQQHYSDVHNGTFLKAATLKGLAIHTADEAGTADGPDYSFGWGVMNTTNAVQAINEEGSTSIISEETLANGNVYSFTIASDGRKPLDITISWTDVAGNPVAPSLNPSDLMLINDLDIRISNGIDTFYPYVLDPANPSAAATAGDNFRDNIEHIHIQNPVAGNYTITVSHKGNLQGGDQDFSLIVTGKRQCYSYAANLEHSMINSFRFGSIQTNSTECATFTNYSAQSTKVYPNTTMDIAVGLGTCGSERNRIVKVFADWNGDTDFEDANELITTSPIYTTSGLFQSTIQVPSNIALHNQVQLLVICMETDDSSQVQTCGIYEYGETEEYTLQLVPTPPILTTFSPKEGTWGTVIQLQGNHFNEVESVLVNNLVAPFTIIDTQRLNLSIPLHATTGSIQLVTIYGDTTQSTADFIVLPPQPPVITTFSPQIGQIGDSLYMYGKNLISIQLIEVNGITTLAIPENDTLVKAIIPNTTSGPIHIANLAGETTSNVGLEILPNYEFQRGAIELCDAIHRRVLANQTQAYYTKSTQVLKPSSADKKLRYEFLKNYSSYKSSRLSIYNGTTTDGELLWSDLGSSTTKEIIYSTHSTGALTIVHEVDDAQDASTTGIWKARVSCYTPEAISIDSLSGYDGYPGEIISIYGGDFFNIETVQFNGVNALFERINKNLIQATVPTEVTTGKVTVYSAIDGQASSNQNFEIKQGRVLISNDTLRVCDIDYYDLGGEGSYPTNDVFIQPIIPSSDNEVIKIEIDSLDLGNNDRLYIYEGIGNGGSFIRVTTDRLPFSYTATQITGALTVVFIGKNASDGYQGFKGHIRCVPVVAPSNINIIQYVKYTPTKVRIVGDYLAGVNKVTIGGESVAFEISSGELWASVEGTESGEVVVTNATGSGKSATDFELLGIKISNKSIKTCGTEYYDTGGPLSSYSHNEDIEQTIFPSVNGQMVRIIVENSDIEFDDNLIIYNGTDTKAPILKVLNGSHPNDTTIAANAAGALTFHFISGKYGYDYGWKAHLDCIAPIATPQISSFEPSSAYIGQEVTIHGANLLGVSTVKVNGYQQNIISITDSLVKITISNATTTTGKITLENSLGSSVSSTNLEVYEEAILNNGILYICNGTYLDPGGNDPYPSPESGVSSIGYVQTLYPTEASSQLSITFSHYDTKYFESTYIYDGTSTDASLLGKLTIGTDIGTFTATNPEGALTIRFGNIENSANNSGWEAEINCIAHAEPIVASFTPNNSYKNQAIEISGSNFIEVSEVSFNGESAIFEVLDFEKIQAFVPLNATSGPIKVINDYGEGTSLNDFMVLDTLMMSTNGAIYHCDYTLVSPTRTNTNQSYSFRQQLYPAEKGKYVKIDFEHIQLGTNDELEIYDGSTKIAEYTGGNLPNGSEELYATNTEGELEIVMRVNGTYGSFVAHVSCVYPFPPEITNVMPNAVMRNMDVEIEGKNFIDIERVEVDGISVAYRKATSEKIHISIPVAVQEGIITVTTAHGEGQYDYAIEEGVVMSNESLYVCDTIIYYDPQGHQKYHTENFKQTIYPGLQGEKIAIDFTYFKLDGASLSIYDGANTTNEDKLIGKYHSLPPRIVASSESGALTLYFDTDYRLDSGWIANVYCYQSIPPTITHIEPDSGYVDETILIKGEDFVNTTQVLFNNVSADFKILSFNTIQAIVPLGASDGPITVSNDVGFALSDTFRVLPGIRMSSTDVYICDEDYIDPNGGEMYENNTELIQTLYPSTTGKKLRLDFDYLDLVDDDRLYIYNGTNTNAELIGEYSDLVEHGVVGDNPLGALTLEFVTNEYGTARGWAAKVSCYTIQGPRVTNFYKKEGYIGEKITIEGHDFFSVSSVKFNGIESPYFEVITNEKIQAIVPTTTSGPITIVTNRGQTSTTVNFNVLDGAVMGNPFIGKDIPLYICDQNLYDLNGPHNSTNSYGRQVIYPAASGKYVQLAITSFYGKTFDVYDGTDHNAKLLKANASAGDTLIATNAQGALFLSINSHLSSWDLEGHVSCYEGGTPIITNFSPNQGYRGSKVVINGNKIANVTNVRFNGIEAEFEVVGANRIYAYVPGEATTGVITVINQEGIFHSTQQFEVIGEGSVMNTINHYLCDQYYYDPAGPDSTITEKVNGGFVQTLYPSSPEARLLLEFEEVDLKSYELKIIHEHIYGGVVSTYINELPNHPFIGLTTDGSIKLELSTYYSSNGYKADFRAKVRCIYPDETPTIYDFSNSTNQDEILSFWHGQFLNRVFSITELKHITIKSLPNHGKLKYENRDASIGTKVNAVYGGDYLTFTPNSGWHGTTSFEYSATNEIGESVNGMITIHVNFVNQKAVVQGITPTTQCALNQQIIDLDLYIDDPNGQSEDFDYDVAVIVRGVSNNLNVDDLKYTYDPITHQLTLSNTSLVDGTFDCDLRIEDGDYTIYSPFSITAKGQPKAKIHKNVLELTASSGDAYRWYRDGRALTDKTTKTIEANILGSYTVEIKQINGCTNTSDPVIIDIATGIEKDDFSKTINLFPNPAQQLVNITIENKLKGEFNIQIIDMMGKVYFQKGAVKLQEKLTMTLPIDKLSRGVYLVKINHPNYSGVKRLVKK